MRQVLLATVLYATACTTDRADGIEATSFPDRLTGTFTRDGVTVAFDFSSSAAFVRTVDDEPLVEATLDTGLHVAEELASHAAGPLVIDLRDALGDDLHDACPPAAIWWRELSGR